MNAPFEYLIRLGDNALILSQRLGEWCGHGPVLEQDIAMTNIALDLLGQARMLLTYAGEMEGKGRTEDDLACFRDAGEFRNVLLVEQPNQDWAYTIVRQFFFDAFQYYNYEALLQSRDRHLAGIAEKSLKEVTYHLRLLLRMDGAPRRRHRNQPPQNADRPRRPLDVRRGTHHTRRNRPPGSRSRNRSGFVENQAFMGSESDRYPRRSNLETARKQLDAKRRQTGTAQRIPRLHAR